MSSLAVLAVYVLFTLISPRNTDNLGWRIMQTPYKLSPENFQEVFRKFRDFAQFNGKQVEKHTVHNKFFLVAADSSKK